MKTYKYKLIGNPPGAPSYAKSLELCFWTRDNAKGVRLAPNRNVKKARLAQMIEEMDGGQWDHEAVNVFWFNLAGELSNGQHRNAAVAHSTIPGIWVLKATTPCDPSVVPEAIMRSISDAFTMRGVANATIVVPMLNLVRKVEILGDLRKLILNLRGRRSGKGREADTKARFSDLWPLYQEHKIDADGCAAEAKAFIAHARDTRGTTALTPANVAFAFWVARTSSNRDAKDLLKRLVIATRADAFKRDDPRVAKAFNAIMASHRRNRFGDGGSSERLSYALELIGR